MDTRKESGEEVLYPESFHSILRALEASQAFLSELLRRGCKLVREGTFCPAERRGVEGTWRLTDPSELSG